MPPIEGAIRFEGVGFHYAPDVEVLEDIDLDFKPGENIALVGSTGAGKTTLVTLIHRFADVSEGRITVDGHDVRDVTTRVVGQPAEHGAPGAVHVLG